MKKEKEFKNEYLVFPQNILSPLTSNQRLGARLTPTIDDEKDRGCLRLWRRAIVLWQAVGSKRENHGLISRKCEREREREEGSEASERDKLESGTGERKLPRAWKRNEDW